MIHSSEKETEILLDKSRIVLTCYVYKIKIT